MGNEQEVGLASLQQKDEGYKNQTKNQTIEGAQKTLEAEKKAPKRGRPAKASAKVQSGLYRCCALCFVNGKLWKPGEKQYSTKPLDSLHWELVPEEVV